MFSMIGASRIRDRQKQPASGSLHMERVLSKVAGCETSLSICYTLLALTDRMGLFRPQR